MNEQFINLILASLWIHGFHCLFAKGFLLGKVGDYLEERYSEYTTKPLFGCTMCMASVHGTLWHFAHYGSVYTWVVFCLCLCGLNYIISKLTSKERIILDDE